MGEGQEITACSDFPADVQRLVDALRAGGLDPAWVCGPTEARRRQEAIRASRPTGPAMARVDDLEAVDVGGSTRLRLFVPPQPKALIVYFHGGGWVMGSVDESDAHARRVAEASGCAVVSVDYRLAPEHPFPAPVQDGWRAWRWCADNVKALAGREAPLILAGDSAGAAIAVAVAMMARDHGGAQPVAQILGYPALGADFETPSYRECAKAPLLTRQGMMWFWDQYAPDPATRGDPLASPLAAAAVYDRLPPALVMAAGCDPLRSDGEIYAERLGRAGVEAEFRVYRGMIHGFYKMADQIGGGRQALADMAAFVARTLG